MPDMQLRTSPRRAEWIEGKTETDRQTTRDFLRQSRAEGRNMVLAVNADAFSPWPAPYNQSTPTDLLGLAVSDGTAVSHGVGTPSLLELKSGAMQIAATTPDTNITNVRNGANLEKLPELLFSPSERANGNNLGVVLDIPQTTHDADLYLFVDDHWIEKQQGVTRVYNQAKPLDQPIIAPDDPKTEADCAWGNVIREADGKFRLWYCTMTMGHNPAGPHEMAAAGVWGRGDDFTFRPRSDTDRPDVESMLGKYAESDDGIMWRKPKVGLIAYRGNKDNNVILNGQRASEQTQGALTNFDGRC